MVSLFQFMCLLLKSEQEKRRIYICVIYMILDIYLFYLKHLELLYVLYT